MVEITENIPFLWRLSSDNGDGFSVVSMVVPFNSGDENHEHTIETDVLSFSSDLVRAEEDEILEWNEDDISLFLKLLSDRVQAGVPSTSIASSELTELLNASEQTELSALEDDLESKKTQTFRVDLTDPDTIEIVHIVAAAGFGMTQPSEGVIVETPYNSSLPDFSHDIGASVSLHTVDGFKQAVIVDSDDEEVVCVLLEAISMTGNSALEDIQPHELLLLKNHQLLPPQFTSESPGRQDVLH